MILNSSFKAAGCIALFAAMNSAWAVTLNDLPGSVLPEQIRDSLTQRPFTPISPRAPETIRPVMPKSTLGENAKKVKFILNGVILEGNTVYSSDELTAIYKNKMHKEISIADLFGIVQDITIYYRNRGYIVTRAILPPQRVKNGVVRIRIVEGFADNVTVIGHPDGVKQLVQTYGEEMIRCKPIRLDCLERYLLIANEIPDTRVRAVLTPSEKTQGAAQLNLVTDHQRFNGYASYDNYGTRFIGPQQMTANVAANSLITAGDSTQLTVTKTPKGGELTYLDANYNMAIGSKGLRWLIGATRVATHPLFVLEPSQIDGLNFNYYTSLQYPMIRSRNENLTLQAGFNFLNSKVTALSKTNLLYIDHVRSLDLSALYNYADRWYGLNFAILDLKKGLPILGYTSDTSPNALTSRPGGHANYTKVNLQLSRLQSLNQAFSVIGIIRTQWSFNPLLASEQFTFGGSQLGRGYDVAEIIGDHGIGGSLELRFDQNIQRFFMQKIQLYTFYDIGKVWNKNEIAGIPTIQSAASAGIGARLYWEKFISANIMWAQPLTKRVAAEQFINEGKRPRVFFSIVASLDGVGMEDDASRSIAPVM